MPIAYQEGHHWYAGGVSAIGSVAGHAAYGYAAHQGISVNALASALAPAPTPRRVGALAAAVLSFIPVLAVGVWMALAVSHHVAPAGTGTLQKGSYDVGAWLIPVFFALPLIGFLAAFLTRVRGNARVRRGQPLAFGVWSHGWLCRRCGGAFFPVGTPLEVPTGEVMALASFRRIVWSAGGYASS
ncbi:hypothetical protein [Catenulispora rubra]|uniref:hypothetical protein n=1 Tax=Catenulispora rubra TaxID=280293 RepID=UPI00189248CC|nr:hypothetical protein [Catenulispora rubra]